MSFCHTLNFLIPISLQPNGSNLWFNRFYSLNYQRSTTLVSKDIWIRKFEFVAKTQFLLQQNSFFLDYITLCLEYKKKVCQDVGLYVCMYVCKGVCMGLLIYVCMSIWFWIYVLLLCLYACLFKFMPLCIIVCRYVCIFTLFCLFVYSYAVTCICVSVCPYFIVYILYVHIYVCMSNFVYVRLYFPIFYVCVCVMSVCICSCTWMSLYIYAFMSVN